MRYSPVQLLMSRCLRDKLPCASHTLLPRIPQDARESLMKQKPRRTKYYNRGSKPRKPLRRGDSVCLRRGRTWDEAVVTEECRTPRWYNAIANDGDRYRRNRIMLKRSSQWFRQISMTMTIPSSHENVLMLPVNLHVPDVPVPAPISRSAEDVPATQRQSATQTKSEPRPQRMRKKQKRLEDYIRS